MVRLMNPWDSGTHSELLIGIKDKFYQKLQHWEVSNFLDKGFMLFTLGAARFGGL